MSEENELRQTEPANRKQHPVLLTVFTLLCFLGLLACRVWYSSLCLGAAEEPRYLLYALMETGIAAVLLLILLFLRQDFSLSASLPLWVITIVFMLLGLLPAYGSDFSRWMNVGKIMLYLPPFLLLLFFPLSAFITSRERVRAGEGFLLFLLLGVVPVALIFLSGELEFVTVYLLSCIVYSFLIHRNGRLDVHPALFWLITLLVLTAVIVLYGFRIAEHFEVLTSRGRSDPAGYGVLLMQVDSALKEASWFGPSSAAAGTWYTANAGYELAAFLTRGGILAAAGALLCALGLSVCMYRMYAGMQNCFARSLTFLTATAFLLETLWNAVSCFFGISARSDLPFLSLTDTTFFIEIILFAAVLSLYRQRELPLADMKGDWWFRFRIRPADTETETETKTVPAVSSLRNPSLKRYLHPDRYYLDTRLDIARAEWTRMQYEARESDITLPENLNETLLPLCILDDTLYLLVPFLTEHGSLTEELEPLLGFTTLHVRFIYEAAPQDDGPDRPEPEAPADAGESAGVTCEDAGADTVTFAELSFAGERSADAGEIPDFDFSPTVPTEEKPEE